MKAFKVCLKKVFLEKTDPGLEAFIRKVEETV